MIAAAHTPTHPLQTVKANARLMMARAGAPFDVAHLRALGAKYEHAYRVARGSKRPPTRDLLFGMAQTARAFYSLAREQA